MNIQSLWKLKGRRCPKLSCHGDIVKKCFVFVSHLVFSGIEWDAERAFEIVNEGSGKKGVRSHAAIDGSFASQSPRGRHALKVLPVRKKCRI